MEKSSPGVQDFALDPIDQVFRPRWLDGVDQSTSVKTSPRAFSPQKYKMSNDEVELVVAVMVIKSLLEEAGALLCWALDGFYVTLCKLKEGEDDGVVDALAGTFEATVRGTRKVENEQIPWFKVSERWAHMVGVIAPIKVSPKNFQNDTTIVTDDISVD